MKNQSHPPFHHDELMNIIIEIFSEILLTLEKSKNNEVQYYDSADVKRLLNISDSTLFRIRKSQKIPYVRIGRKIFYPKSFLQLPSENEGIFLAVYTYDPLCILKNFDSRFVSSSVFYSAAEKNVSRTGE
ncbi:helix-turn-helix domain-containing protein [Chryseobacterium nepalense]|uniref:Helix-turn-helix domain-containing protein n=1 Tax=Chryseobacterium nepalense TaxID=1854498 RepID=A0ABY4KAF3_9FLAO|nr:helix-turn-helix domain-containing protein [Chryseobacterium nepalense]UPQ76753.1 helix-turn-helix domain-containing protein [Chryseobacterium nepalense]